MGFSSHFQVVSNENSVSKYELRVNRAISALIV